MNAVQTIIITVPCYNEATRLVLPEFTRLLSKDDRISLVFVDDGSSDKTSEVLKGFSSTNSARIHTLILPENVGKAEAVRAGLVYSLTKAPDAVGYIDADLATPVDEVWRLVQKLFESDFGAILGSRVSTMGTNIQRNPARHYLGRVFATAASIALSAPIYDTQCGAKMFRNSPGLQNSVQTKFLSRWAFDVEFLGRLMSHRISVVEVPLQEWKDVAGSKMRFSSMVNAGLDLVRIGISLRSKGSLFQRDS